VNGDTVPVQSAGIQNFLIKQSAANPAFLKMSKFAAMSKALSETDSTPHTPCTN
jgi:hypothetical protein